MAYKYACMAVLRSGQIGDTGREKPGELQQKQV